MDRDGQAAPKPAEHQGQRERAADIREARADQRELEADQREGLVDRREREADQREDRADERERAADEREEQMEGLIGELRGLVTGAHRDALEAIERSQTLLLSSAGSLERTKEAAKRTDARGRREQAAIARAAAYSERRIAHPLPAGQGAAGQARAMRIRLAATAAAFA